MALLAPPVYAPNRSHTELLSIPNAKSRVGILPSSMSMGTLQAPVKSANNLPKISTFRRFGCPDMERIYHVLKESIRRFEDQQLVQCIISDDKKIFSIRNTDLRGMLLKHQHLSARTKFSSDEECEFAIHDSLKNILRFTQQTGVLLSSYASNEQIPASLIKFYSVLEEFSELMKTRLLTGWQEETKLQKLQLEKLEKTRHLVTAVQTLTETLNEKSNAAVLDLASKDKIVQGYTQDLKSRLLIAETNNKEVLKEATKEILKTQGHMNGLQSKMQKDIISLSNAHATQIKPDLLEEGELRKRKTKMYVELMNWIDKYDEHMGRMQDELEDLRFLHSIDLKNLAEMDERFAALKTEYDIIVEEKRRILEEETRRKKEELEQSRCCLKIQAVYRGHLHRTGFYEKKGKKDKKGKKKGGGKKKKK